MKNLLTTQPQIQTQRVYRQFEIDVDIEGIERDEWHEMSYSVVQKLLRVINKEI